MAPTVSVILCSYNQAGFIQESIESVLRQTYTETELVLVDNGSTDGTSDILDEYENDARIRLIRHRENGAVTRRLNEAISVSKGSFISILYSDDYYLPHKLQNQVKHFEKLGPEYGVVYSPGYRLNELTKERWLDPSATVSGDILEPLLKDPQCVINPITPLIRRECCLRYPYLEQFFIEGEAIFWRYALTYRFTYLAEPLAVMRDHDQNIGKSIKTNISRLMAVLDHLKSEPELPQKHQRSVDLLRARILRDAAWQGVRVLNDPVWARECYRQAVHHDRHQALHPRTLAGMVLTVFPGSVRRTLNRAANSVRRSRANVLFAERADTPE